jgi:hypothetical protein
MAAPTDRIGVRQFVIWAVFSMLFVAGLVLYFRHVDAVRPLLDLLIE